MDTHASLLQIEKIALNARATWFGLLAWLLFVGITALSHKDSDFVAYGAETALPLVGISIPTTSFFVAAPVVTSALYIYLHIYLGGLWNVLAKCPGRIDDDPLEERAYPTLLCTFGLVLRRWMHPKSPQPVEGPRHATVTIVFSMLWLFGPAVLAALWWRAMASHLDWLALWMAFCLWISLVAGAFALSELSNEMRSTGTRSRSQPQRGCFRLSSKVLLLFGLFAGLAAVSWDATKGGHVLPLVAADMSGTNLTLKPADWRPYDIWHTDWEERFRTREGIPAGDHYDAWPSITHAQFRSETAQRWFSLTQALHAPDLEQSDLRHADLGGAFMSGINLGFARLENAILRQASLEGATLRNARLEGADMMLAQLQGADLSDAHLDQATLTISGLQGVNLSNATMKGADLQLARLDDANLSSADLRDANLTVVDIERTNFFEARLDRAELTHARIQDAGFQRTRMDTANLAHAWISRANFSGARMQGANLTDAIVSGSNFRSVDLSQVVGITQTLVNQNFGDVDTLLPEGLVKPCHWDNKPPLRVDYLESDPSYMQWLSEGAIPVPRKPDGTCS
jgi:uncharacterized protein YjbI with pentapeptide repeats